MVFAAASVALANGMPYVGVTVKQVNPDDGVLPDRFDGGLQVTSVKDASPAEKAGLKKGDIILRINLFLTPSSDKLVKALSEFEPGSCVELLILRGDKLKEIPLTLGRPPKPADKAGEAALKKEIDEISEEIEALTGKWRRLKEEDKEEEADECRRKARELEKRLFAAKKKYNALQAKKEGDPDAALKRFRARLDNIIEMTEEFIRKNEIDEAEELLVMLKRLLKRGESMDRSLPDDAGKELKRILKKSMRFIEAARNAIKEKRGGTDADAGKPAHGDLRKEIDRLRREVNGLKKDIREIKRMLKEILKHMPEKD
jgi:hypothetical protein